MILRECGPCVRAKKPIDHAVVITEVRQLGLNRGDVRIRVLIDIAGYPGVVARIIIVRVVVIGVVRVVIPRVIPWIQAYPGAGVIDPPVTIPVVRMPPIPILVPTAIVALEDMVASAQSPLIRRVCDRRTRNL